MPHSARRQALLRAARKNAGLVLLRVWVPANRVDELREVLKKILEKEPPK